jgi:PKHD-type hydroxylase
MSQPSAAPLPLVYRFPTGVRVEAGVGSLAWPAGAGPFGQALPAEPNPMISSVYWQPGLLTAEECDALIGQGSAMPRMEGRAELSPDDYRVSQIAWIQPEPRHHGLYHKLGVLFMQCAERYRCDLSGFLDPLQFTEYGAGQFFEWHMDTGRDESSLRKLSATIQLSDPGDYDGGMLEFIGLGAQEESRQRGSVTVFPSYMAHRVTPVTRGIRRSLVAWATGAPYR